MKLLIISLLFAGSLSAQSNAIQLCDQQGTVSRHCLSIHVPSTLSFTPAPIMISGNSGALLLGMPSTDLHLSPGDMVANTFVSANASANSSVMSMGATPSTGGADISVGKTGTGALLPLRFWRNPQELARFDTSNRFLIGLTASDVSAGVGSMILGGSLVMASNTCTTFPNFCTSANASVLSMTVDGSGHAFISAGQTGTGAVPAIVFFRNPNEVGRFDNLGRLLVGSLGSSDVNTLAGAIISANSFVSTTAATNASVGSMAAVSGNYVAIASSSTGTGTFLPMTFFTSNAERVRIQTDGKVGIGTPSPSTALDVAGTINASVGFSSANSTFNTVNIPSGGVFSLNNTVGNLTTGSVTYAGTNPQVDASNLKGNYNINGSSTASGKIVLSPGNVAGLSSVQINGRSNGSAQTQSLILNEVGASAGSGISIFHNGVYDGAWQAGSTTSFDVVNNALSHSFVILQTGKTLVGRTSDNGTGALMQVEGGLSIAGSLVQSGVTRLDASGNLTVASCTGCSTGGGTVTSVATAFPVTGGTFTTSGTIGCATCLTTAGNQTVTGVSQFNGGIRVWGGGIDASGLAGLLTVTGASSGNGNINFLPGNVSGLTSVSITGNNWGSPLTSVLILNDNVNAGAGITIRHSNIFDGAWQGGSTTPFGVTNNASQNVWLVFQNGHIKSTTSGAMGFSTTNGACVLVSGSNDVRGAMTCSFGSLQTGSGTTTFGSAYSTVPFCTISQTTPGFNSTASGLNSIGTNNMTWTMQGTGLLRIDYTCRQ